MSCYKDGGCGVYEMYSCYECPASKPEYLKRKSHEPQRLQAIGSLHDVAKQILDDEVVILLRQYGTTLAPGRMGDESRVPKLQQIRITRLLEINDGLNHLCHKALKGA